MVIIPFQNYSSFTEEVTLSDVSFVFSFHYNFRGDFWVMTISDRAQNILVGGIKVVSNFELIRRYIYTGIPNGYLTVINNAGTSVRISVDDLANEFFNIVYADASEIA